MSWFRRSKRPDPKIEWLESISETLDMILHVLTSVEETPEIAVSGIKSFDGVIGGNSVTNSIEWANVEKLSSELKEERVIPMAETTFERSCSICGEPGRNARTCRPGFGHMSESEWRHLCATE